MYNEWFPKPLPAPRLLGASGPRHDDIVFRARGCTSYSCGRSEIRGLVFFACLGYLQEREHILDISDIFQKKNGTYTASDKRAGCNVFDDAKHCQWCNLFSLLRYSATRRQGTELAGYTHQACVTVFTAYLYCITCYLRSQRNFAARQTLNSDPMSKELPERPDKLLQDSGQTPTNPPNISSPVS